MEERFEMFTIMIAKASRYIKRIKTEEMSEFELKTTHVSCIYYLYKKEKLTSKELCDICEEDKASISRSIEYLEKNKYIKCLDQVKKRYKSPLVLTEKGLEVGKKIEAKIDNILAKSSEGLSAQEREIFYKSFVIICDNLQKIYDNYSVDEKEQNTFGNNL